MPIYQVRVQQTIERVVQVRAWSHAQAREMAERGEGGWIDGGRGTSVGIEALDVSREPDGEVDCMDEWKYRAEAQFKE